MPTCAGSREGVSASREVRAGRHLAGSSALKESVRDAKDVPFLLLLLNQPLALHLRASYRHRPSSNWGLTTATSKRSSSPAPCAGAPGAW